MFNHFQGVSLGEPPMLPTSLPTKLSQSACEVIWLLEYDNIQLENFSKTYWGNPHQFIKFQREEIPESEMYSYTDGCKGMVYGHSQPPSVPCIFSGGRTALETIQVRYLGVIQWIPFCLSNVATSLKREAPPRPCYLHSYCCLPTIFTGLMELILSVFLLRIKSILSLYLVFFKFVLGLLF